MPQSKEFELAEFLSLQGAGTRPAFSWHTSSFRFRSRSRVEGDKRTERFEIEHGPCHCQKQRDGGDHGSGV